MILYLWIFGGVVAGYVLTALMAKVYSNHQALKAYRHDHDWLTQKNDIVNEIRMEMMLKYEPKIYKTKKGVK